MNTFELDFTYVVAGLVAALPMVALAQSPAVSVDLFNSLETEFVLSDDFRGQKSELIYEPELLVEFRDGSTISAIGRIRADFDDNISPGKPQRWERADYARPHDLSDDIQLELRELYWDTTIGDAFLRLGKQQIVWGQADGLKVLDVLNPQSFREFILDDFEDSRIPLWSANAEIPVGEGLLQLVWIPETTYDELAEPGATFDFTSSRIVPALPQDTAITKFLQVKPSRLVKDSDFAIKYSLFTNGWDLSVNYAYHYVDRPVTRVVASGPGLEIEQSFERTHLLGGTFSNVFGDFTLRGEIGFSTDQYFLSSTTENGVDDSEELTYVLGLDFQGWRDWFVSGQLFQSIVPDHRNGFLRDEVATRATFLVRRDLFNDSLQLEGLLVQSIDDSDGVLQLEISYELTSSLKFIVSGDYFFGSHQGLFGQFDEKDRFSAGFEYGF